MNPPAGNMMRFQILKLVGAGGFLKLDGAGGFLKLDGVGRFYIREI